MDLLKSVVPVIIACIVGAGALALNGALTPDAAMKQVIRVIIIVVLAIYVLLWLASLIH